MIMKKFEAMEQVIAATKSAAGAPQAAGEGAASGAAGAEGAHAGAATCVVCWVLYGVDG